MFLYFCVFVFLEKQNESQTSTQLQKQEETKQQETKLFQNQQKLVKTQKNTENDLRTIISQMSMDRFLKSKKNIGLFFVMIGK